MKTKTLLMLTFALASGAAYAAGEPMVGGSPMYPSKTIVENASQAKNLTTLVTAVKDAGLVETLSGKGPFTVFAPTNEAFDQVPKAALDSLLKTENKEKLKKILTYHVVPGKIDSQQLMADVKKNGGKAELKTVEGSSLTVTEQGGKLMIADAAGHKAEIVNADVTQSNGEVHVIDHVLMPPGA